MINHTLLKLKMSALRKTLLNKWTHKPQTGWTYFQIIKLTKNKNPEYVKHSQDAIIYIKPNKNMGKDLNKQCIKKINGWQISIWKDVTHC